MSQRYTVTYRGTEYELEIERQGNELFISHANGRYSVRVSEERGALPDAGTGASDAGPLGASGAGPAASAAGPAASAVSPLAASDAIGAPMTGVVKTIHVGVGDSVQSGQLVVTMEAMKMDIQVNAAAAGTVATVTVAAGDSVQQNAPLMILG